MEHAADDAAEHATPPPTSAPAGRGGRAAAVSELLEQLGERVRPVVPAGERTLPIDAALAPLLPERGLVRGRVLACRGPAAVTLASTVVRDAVAAGAWLAVVDVGTFGVDAAAEAGLALERLVRVDTGCAEPEPDDGRGAERGAERGDGRGAERALGAALGWIDVMGAAVDGFDVVIARVPAALRGDRRPAAVRKLAARIRQRGAVVVTLGDGGALGCDVELRTVASSWSGLGEGCGHLRARRIDVEASGRRLPGARSCSLDLVGVDRRVVVSAAERSLRSVPDVAPSAPAHAPSGAGDGGAERDPQAEVLAELAHHLERHDPAPHLDEATDPWPDAATAS